MFSYFLVSGLCLWRCQAGRGPDRLSGRENGGVAEPHSPESSAATQNSFRTATGINTRVRGPPGCQTGSEPLRMRRRTVAGENPDCAQNSATDRNWRSSRNRKSGGASDSSRRPDRFCSAPLDFIATPATVAIKPRGPDYTNAPMLFSARSPAPSLRLPMRYATEIDGLQLTEMSARGMKAHLPASRLRIRCRYLSTESGLT